jgi:hypothetical protein
MRRNYSKRCHSVSVSVAKNRKGKTGYLCCAWLSGCQGQMGPNCPGNCQRKQLEEASEKSLHKCRQTGDGDMCLL